MCVCARLISVPFEADLLLFRDFSGRIQLDSNPFFREKRDAGWRGGGGGGEDEAKGNGKRERDR